jgi:hypothetical protein
MMHAHSGSLTVPVPLIRPICIGSVAQYCICCKKGLAAGLGQDVSRSGWTRRDIVLPVPLRSGGPGPLSSSS